MRDTFHVWILCEEESTLKPHHRMEKDYKSAEEALRSASRVMRLIVEEYKIAGAMLTMKNGDISFSGVSREGVIFLCSDSRWGCLVPDVLLESNSHHIYDIDEDVSYHVQNIGEA